MKQSVNDDDAASLSPSLVVFGPQETEWPSDQDFRDLRAALLVEPNLQSFREAILALPSVWAAVEASDQKLRRVPGLDFIRSLVRWVEHGEAPRPTDTLANVFFTPLTIIIHIVRYISHISRPHVDTTHSSLLASSKHGGGIQGFCTGLLSAIAVACSKDEGDVGNMGARALRLAVCVGAYIDLDGAFAEPPQTMACLAVRWCTGASSVEEMQRLCHDHYSGAYVSVIADATTVTLTAPLTTAIALERILSESGMQVKHIGLQGRFHSIHLEDAARKIIQLSRNDTRLQLPEAEQLLTPVRSNANAQIVSKGNLTEIAIKSILTELADWRSTTVNALDELKTVTNPVSLLIGSESSIPKAEARRRNLKVKVLRRSAGGRAESPSPPNPSSILAGTDTPPLEASATTSNDSVPEHAIAIIGMGCKFPGADSISEFWEVIRDSVSHCRRVPEERFADTGLRRTPDGKGYFGNFVNDAATFDHKFFKKSTRESSSMDPQQRQLLQVAYHALESAGWLSDDVKDRDCGCYIGVCATDYNDNVASHPPTAFSTLGTLRAFLSGKISHHFGWTGPSITYDTACSSSAVAIDAACKAITLGDCSSAIAGGVNLFTNPNFFQNLEAGTFLSPTGPTKAFDASADGYCRGEGVGLVLLKRLSTAMADRDHILGVIRGSAVNQNSNSTYITVPHSPSQAELYRKVLRMSRLKAEDVSFVEAHGTGTAVGDPIECESIRQVLGSPTRAGKLFLGSVKSNIGHTEGASGVAALIKAVLMIQHGVIPRQANFSKLNPKIAPPLDRDRMEVPTSTQQWDSVFRAALINNYGAAGSNAAMLVAQPPPPTVTWASNVVATPPAERLSLHPIFLSAATRPALQSSCANLSAWIESNKGLISSDGDMLASIAFNLSRKTNRALPMAINQTVRNLNELQSVLSAVTSGDQELIAERPSKTLPIVLAFSGQYSTYVGLSQGLYESSRRLKYHLDECDRIICKLGHPSIYPCIFQQTPIEDVVVLHSTIFSMQYASAVTWIECGMKVDAVIGHSFGQLTALCVSGVLSLEDGLKLMSGRAALMQSHWGSEPGSMISIEASTDQVTALLEASKPLELETACFNGPTSHILVGEDQAISRLEAVIRQDNRFAKISTKRLNVSHGFHSRFTDPLLPHLESLAQSLKFQKPTIHLETCSEETAWATIDAKSITEHTRQPVYFGEAVHRLADRFGPCSWVDATFNTPIVRMVQRALGSSASSHQFCIPRSSPAADVDTLIQNTKKLWEWGYKMDFWPFDRVQKDEYKHLDLPPYPFEKSQHWLTWQDFAAKPAQQPAAAPAKVLKDPVLLTMLQSSNGVSELAIDPRCEEWKIYVGGHAVVAQPLCPAPLYMELVTRAAILVAESKSPSGFVPRIDDMEIHAPLGLDSDRNIFMTLKKIPATSQSYTYVVRSRLGSDQSEEPTEHATGSVTLIAGEDPQCDAELARFNRLIGTERAEGLLEDPEANSMRGALVYKMFSRVVEYDGIYKGVRSVSAKNQEVGGLVRLPAFQNELLKKTVCLPLALDNFVQVAGLHVNSLSECDDNAVYVCTSIGRVQFGKDFQKLASESTSWLVYSKYAALNDKEITNDIFVFDARTKMLVMFILDAHFARVMIRSLTKVLERANPQIKKTTSAAPPRQAAEEPVSIAGKFKTPSTPSPAPPKKRTKGAGPAQAVYTLLARVADIDTASISPNSELADLGIDSLMSAELIREINQTFNVDLAPEVFQDVTDVKSLCDVLVSRVPGLDPNSTGAPGDESGFTSSTVSTLDDSSELSSTDISSSSETEDVTSNVPERLSRVICQTLETSSPMSRSTNLADEGLDSLLGIELINEIEKEFSTKVELTADTTFGDLLDVLNASQPRAPEPQINSRKSKKTSPPKGSGKASTPNIAVSDFDSEGAPLSNVQEAFHSIREDYDKYAEETGFAGFWTKTYPSQATLVVAYVVEAFKSLGSSLKNMQAGDRLSRIRHLDKHEMLVDQLYEILADASLISRVDDYWVRTTKPVPEQPASNLLKSVLQKEPQHGSEHKLLDITGARLADCLTGAADPLQLLFRPAANRELLEDVYTNGPMYEAVTKQLGSFLMKAFSSSKSQEPFHILEVGGGTGGTSKYVLELLSRNNVPITYTFTDLSPTLVTAAKRKFAKYDFVRFQTLDVEKEPPAALKGKFHTILSTNCVHATKDLTVSTGNIRKMLRPDGFLSVVEFTKNIFWFDLVFGLLDGWWFFTDGRKHVLADEYFWRRSMLDAGYQHVDWTQGEKQESNTLRIITAFQSPQEIDATPKSDRLRSECETVVFKQTGESLLYADVYYPQGASSIKQRRPVALLFHGGGHMMLSRKDINPRHVKEILDQGFIPISVDFRLCPELNLIDGPMADACDAVSWARHTLPQMRLRYPGIRPDGERVVCIGWSAGGHLAMTTAWTVLSRGIKAPEAITAFYCPTDYEDSCWTTPNYPGGTEADSNQTYDLLEGVGTIPVTQYNLPADNRPLNGWLSVADPRSRIILHANWKGQALPILLNGLPHQSTVSSSEQSKFNAMPIPSKDAIRSISPYAQICQGKYKTPTYAVHGTKDDLIPWQQTQRVYEALRAQGVSAEVAILDGTPHLFDLFGSSEEEAKAVSDGFKFLARHM